MNERCEISLEQLKNFEIYLREEEKSDATIEKYMRDLRKFLQFVDNRSVDKAMILEYKANLAKEYAVTSANSMLAAMNTFLRFIGFSNLCVKQFKVQRKTYCTENKELTKADYLKLIHEADRVGNERLSLVIQTICATGIRVSELQYITVESAKKGESVVSCKGKTRIIFIVSSLCKKLLKYAKKQKIKSGVIFISNKGNPLNRSNIWREMKALCEKAGVLAEKVFPHNLRHLFARTFYEVKRDIVKLADILGHTNINTTRIYTITTRAEHKRYMEKMCLVL